jgi:hypothetical protein
MPMPGLILHFQAVCACRQQYGCGGIDITDGQKLVEDAKGSFRRMSSPAFFERKLAGEVNVLICLGVQRVIRSENWSSPSFGVARVRVLWTTLRSSEGMRTVELSAFLFC